MYGGTKAGEIARTSELLDELSREHGVYFAIAFIYDIGYGREDLKAVLEDMKNRRIGFRTPKE